jgi:hypothetical protein
MKHLDYHMRRVGMDLEAGGGGMHNIQYKHLLELNHQKHQWKCKLKHPRRIQVVYRPETD